MTAVLRRRPGSSPAASAGRRTVDRVRSLSIEEAFAELASSAAGLSESEAASRLAVHGPNAVHKRPHFALRILVRQLRNPLLAVLVAATVVAFAVGERTDAVIIVAIVTLSVGLGFFDEFRADQAAQLLESKLTRSALAVREGELRRVPAEKLVPGDVIAVETGDIVAADARVFHASSLAVDEAALTGESLPVDKGPDVSGEGDGSVLFAGTVIKAGNGRALVVATGADTAVAAIAGSLGEATAATEFERGLGRFSLFLVAVTAVLTTFIFIANAALGHGVLDAFLFSLAIAVGLTPQLLPAIVTVSLAMGGRRLAHQRVIVRHLVAIEDLGNVEVLFSDKTGTLTSGEIALDGAIDPGDGGDVLRWAAAWPVAGAAQRIQQPAGCGTRPRSPRTGGRRGVGRLASSRRSAFRL